MKTYFQYLFRTLVKRSSIWIVFAIYWIYALVILIIVPAVTHISPLTLWSTDIISLQGMFVVIISVTSGVVVVFTFRASIEDETELVIVSKPIKRWKLNFIKFSWVVIAAAFLALVTSIIALFTMCFGAYDAVSNPSGMQFDKVLPLIGSIWLGTIVVSLIFSSFGILVSMVGNKIQILVALIATSIVFSVYATIASFILTPLAQQMQPIVGDKINSFKVIDNSGKADAYAFTYNQPNNDLFELYLQYPQTGNRIYQYFNFQTQQAGLYNCFNVNDLDVNLGSMPFGASATYDTIIESGDDNLFNYLDNLYSNSKNKDYYLLMMPFTSAVLWSTDYTIKADDSSRLLLIGPKTDVLFAMKYAGSKPNSIYVSNSTKLFEYFPARWLTMDELYVSDELDKKIFTDITQKLLEDTENKGFKTVTGDWKIVDNAPYDPDPWKNQQQLFEDYFDICYAFMKNNSKDLPHDNEQDINDSMGKIQIAMLKQFAQIYWFQVIDQIIQHYKNVASPAHSDYSFHDYILCEDYSEDWNNLTSFQDSFTSFDLSIKNPYDETKTINVGAGFKLINLVRMCMAYTSACLFSNSSSSSSIAQIMGMYNTIGSETFAGSYAHVKKISSKTTSDSWGFDYTNDNYGRKRSMIFNALPANSIDIRTTVNQYGLSNMYRYDTEPYIDNTVAAIVWTAVSLIMVGIAAIVYQRADIK